METETIDWDSFYEDDDGGNLGNDHGNVIKHLISQIRIGMDLTKVVLPTFILEKRSLLEMYADFFAHPDLFSSIPEYKTPEERMIQLVRWYLSAFHAGRKSSVAKKPYNPILGETFHCHWNLDSSSSNGDQTHSTQVNNNNGESATNSNLVNSLTFTAEQVSHHPPVSAFYVENPSKQISCCAHIYTKSKFLGLSVGVHNIGQGAVELLEHNETYVCTFPSAYGRSILTVPWVELGGEVSIECKQTGYSATIEFLTKPFYGGKKNLIVGQVLRPNKEKILSLEGEWNSVMFSKDAAGTKQVFVDTKSLPIIPKHVKSVNCQEDLESRNVWKEVTRALKQKDVNAATAHKSAIEQKQRDLLKARAEKDEKWKPRYFDASGDIWLHKNPLSKQQSKS